MFTTEYQLQLSYNKTYILVITHFIRRRFCSSVETVLHYLEKLHLFIHLTRRLPCVLFSAPPVFVLHFVEGLPDNDVRLYTFSFKGKRYSVTTVIQYDRQLKHFVTWLCNSDGAYFEADSVVGLLHFFHHM